MPTVKFTKGLVERLKPPQDGEALYFDSSFKPKGGQFGIRITASGSTSYIIQGGRFPSMTGQGTATYRARRRTIGDTNLLTLDEARTAAQEALAQMVKGIDPWAEKKAADSAALHETATAPTLATVLKHFLATKKQMRPATKSGYEKTLRRHCGDWLDRPIREITAEKVRTRHIEIHDTVARDKRSALAKGNHAANGTMKAVRALWNHALLFEFIPAGSPNPVTILSKADAWYEEQPREIAIPTDELPKFYRELTIRESVPSERRDTVHSHMVLLMLFTGMRCGETRQLQWKDIDFSDRMIRVPAEITKTRTRLDLPMSGYIEWLLHTRLKACGGDPSKPLLGHPVTPYVFPGTGRSGHAEEPKALLISVHKKAGLRRYYSPHVLRHTFITLAEMEFGIPTTVVRRLTNHSLRGDIHASYGDKSPERLRKYVDQISEGLLKLCSSPESVATQGSIRTKQTA